MRVDLPSIRQHLGLATGGAEAMLALALITGGDYDVTGLPNVGPGGAMHVIRHLLKGYQVGQHQWTGGQQSPVKVSCSCELLAPAYHRACMWGSIPVFTVSAESLHVCWWMQCQLYYSKDMCAVCHPCR